MTKLVVKCYHCDHKWDYKDQSESEYKYRLKMLKGIDLILKMGDLKDVQKTSHTYKNIVNYVTCPKCLGKLNVKRLWKQAYVKGLKQKKRNLPRVKSV
tara:strand:+ start:3089 stop:3382 length:294 start_codon:yes stop_codon:yes gene_type:complete